MSRLVRVLRVGLLPPHENAAFVDEQMRLGHRYRNALAAIERARREAIRQIERRAGDLPALEQALVDAELVVARLAKDLKATRSSTRTRSETAEQKKALADARAEEKRCFQLLAAARAQVRQDPEIIEAKLVVDGARETQRGVCPVPFVAATLGVCPHRPRASDADRGECEDLVAVCDGRALDGKLCAKVPERDAQVARKGGLAGAARRGARALSGVGWGIYARVEAQAEAARKDIDKRGLYDKLLPNDPHFVPWTGDGFVGAQQLTGGITLAELCSGDDTRVRLCDGVKVKQVWDPAARVYRSVVDLHAKRKGNGGRARSLWIRLGKGDDATWCAWPLLMHREIPPGTLIKEVVVQCEMRGHRQEWFATMTVEVDSEELSQEHGGAMSVERAKTGALALDLGWRPREDGSVRVGVWQATDGKTGEIAIPAQLAAKLSKAASIRSIRDTNLDLVRPLVAEWLKDHASILPAWLARDAEHLNQWKSHRRMRSLALFWAKRRFAGDDECFDLLEAWRYRDHHLWCYEEGARTRALRARKQFYRIVAKDLASRYHTLVVEKFDLRAVARRPDAGAPDDDGTSDGSRSMRQFAAPSNLRLILKEVFADFAEVPAMNTTRECNVCGAVHPFDAAKSIERWVPCPACGAAWDQDANAAINILRLWQKGDGPAKKRNVVGRSRFERAVKTAAAKRAERAARAEAPKVAE